jgi:16S rRNA C1402 (ribose-2'-O) methylase RsmI
VTQVHEEFWRGTLESAASEFASREGGARGEITLVIEGVSESSLRAAGSGAFGAASTAEAAAGPRSGAARSGRAGLEASIGAMLADGASPSEAARRAVAEHGARRKEAYALAQRLKSKAADEEEEEEE